MEQQRPQWAEQLKETPFTQRRFTEQIRVRTMERVHGQKRPWPRYKVSAIAGIMAMAAVVYQFAAIGGPGVESPAPSYGDTVPAITDQAGPGYHVLETTKMKVYYDDEDGYWDDPFTDRRAPLVSDKPFGYRYHLVAPVEDLLNRTFAVYATHTGTGQRVTAVSPITIDDRNEAYNGKDTYAVSFALPVWGAWRIEGQLDGRIYDAVDIEAGDLSWDISSTFMANGQSLRGDEGKVGFTDGGFTAGKESTYRWYFWGDEELEGAFMLRAARLGDTRMIDLFAAEALGGPMDGADRQIQVTFALPETGGWRLLPFVDGRLLNSLVIEVADSEEDSVRQSIAGIKREVEDRE
jgi:hypothetical protein